MGRKFCIYPALLTAEQRDRRVDASQFVAADGRTRRSRNERYGKSSRSSAETSSLRLDVGGPDHLAPFLGFLGDQLSELSRRSRQRRAAEVSETGLHLRVVESRVDLLVELVDDLGRRGLRCAEAVPNTPLVARQELTHGRDVWQRVRARRGGYCERTQPASPDVFDHRGHGGERYLHLSTEQVRQ